MAGAITTTRRAFLKAAPVVMVAGAVPALAEPESEIMRLFKKCGEVRAQIDAPGQPRDVTAAELDRLHRLESQMIAIPAGTIEELAAKIMVWTGYANPDDGFWDATLDPMIFAEIRRLTGFTGD